MLGSMEEVVECVKNADVLKPAKSAAEELLRVLSSEDTGRSVSYPKVKSHALTSPWLKGDRSLRTKIIIQVYV